MRWKLVATAVRQMQFRPQPPAGKWLPCFLALPRPRFKNLKRSPACPTFRAAARDAPQNLKLWPSIWKKVRAGSSPATEYRETVTQSFLPLAHPRASGKNTPRRSAVAPERTKAPNRSKPDFHRGTHSRPQISLGITSYK